MSGLTILTFLMNESEACDMSIITLLDFTIEMTALEKKWPQV